VGFSDVQWIHGLGSDRAPLLELASLSGENWPMVSGQMVFLHEVERSAAEVRPTGDVDVDIRAEPAALGFIHTASSTAGARAMVVSISALWSSER